MKNKINPRNPDTFVFDEDGNMKFAKIWIGTFHNGNTQRFKGQNRKEIINNVFPIFGLSLSCFKSLRIENKEIK